MQNNNQEAKVLACIAQPFATNALLLIKEFTTNRKDIYCSTSRFLVLLPP